jgi:hypothetical protein
VFAGRIAASAGEGGIAAMSATDAPTADSAMAMIKLELTTLVRTAFLLRSG